MKNYSIIKKIKFCFLMLISVLLAPFGVSAADDMTYYVSNLGGNGIAGFYSYAYYQKTTEYQNASYKSPDDCTAAGGTLDKTDCLYWKYTYSVMCGPETDYNRCDTAYINSYPRYKTLYIATTNKTSANNACASNAGYTWVKCSGSTQRVNRSHALSISNTKQTCQNAGFQSSGVLYNYKRYGNGYYAGCNTDYSTKICKCTTTSSETTSGYTYKNLTTAHASIKNDKGESVTAYCISPGLPFPSSSIPYESVIEEFDLNKCGQNGGSKYGCGIASIMLTAKEKGYDGEYATMITAFRLWAARMGQEPDGNWSTDLVTTNPIYKTTAQKADGGYLGTDDKTLKDQYVIHATGSGLTHLQHAIELYNTAVKGEFETWVPYITNGSTPIPINENGRFEFVITTNFSDEHTTDIAVQSKTSGVSLSISSKGPCGDKYCINVSGSISGFDRKSCNVSSMTYELQYKDDRNAMGAIGLLRPKSNSKYQKFAFFDKSKIGQLVKLDKPIIFECPPAYECPQPKIIYDQTTGCHNEGTTGELIDPTIDCIVNVERLNNNYDFSDIYIHSTGEGHTNDYCEVKCRETINYEMHGQTNAASVRFIKYTNGSHDSNDLIATISGERDCVAQINYDSWKKDYEDANELVRTTWNTYKYWENVHVYTTPEKEDVECKFNHPKSECVDSCNCHKCHCTTTTTTNEDGSTSTTESCDTCCSDGPGAYCNKEGFFLHWLPKEYAETNEDGSITIAESAEDDGVRQCSGSCCSGTTGCYIRNGSYNAWAGAYTSAKNAYEKAVRAREELVGYIQDCNLHSSFNLRSAFGYSRSNDLSVYYESTEGYDFDPEYEYEYEDEYNSLIEISKDTELTNYPSHSYCVGCSETSAMGGSTTEELKYWTCTGTQTGAKCTDIKVTVPKNTMALMEGIKKETYYWQSVVFSSLVPDGTVVPEGDYTTLSLSDQNIFPIEIGKLSGKYYANATHGNVGDADRKQIIDYEEGEQGAEYIDTYECDFIVDNEITIMPPRCPNGVCPPDPCPGCSGKYGYYFRQIDLTNMFPSGVKTGTWSTIQAQELISEIESKGEEIYRGTPDYEFIITPKNIRNIKEYNREVEAYGQGYNDFNLTCDCEEGICYCNSIFFETISDGGAYEDLVTVYKKDGIEYRSGN